MAEALQEYQTHLSQIIQILKQIGEGEASKILNHLLGQQLLNNQDTNNDLLLALELPLIFPQVDTPLPLYLQIWREKKEKNNQNISAKDNFKISFIITINKMGTIKADITITSSHIKCKFRDVSFKTLKLIKKNHHYSNKD